MLRGSSHHNYRLTRRHWSRFVLPLGCVCVVMCERGMENVITNQIERVQSQKVSLRTASNDKSVKLHSARQI